MSEPSARTPERSLVASPSGDGQADPSNGVRRRWSSRTWSLSRVNNREPSLAAMAAMVLPMLPLLTRMPRLLETAPRMPTTSKVRSCLSCFRCWQSHPVRTTLTESLRWVPAVGAAPPNTSR